MPSALRLLGLTLLALPVLALTGCGDTPTIPQVAAATAFAAANVTVRQLGNAPATIEQSSVAFKLDASHAVVADLDVRSRAARPVTIVVRGSLYDAKGNVVGDVTGGQVNVAPGSTAHVQLTGPTPLGTIAAVTFEVSVAPLPT